MTDERVAAHPVPPIGRPSRMLSSIVAVIAIAVSVVLTAGADEPAPHVIVISLDGLKPESYTQHGRRRNPDAATSSGSRSVRERCGRRVPHGHLPGAHDAHHRGAAGRSRHLQQPAARSREPFVRRLVLVRPRHQGADLAGCRARAGAGRRGGQLARHGRSRHRFPRSRDCSEDAGSAPGSVHAGETARRGRERRGARRCRGR